MVKRIIELLCCCFLGFACEPQKIQTEKLTDWVDPFIGTDYHGHTFPGAAYPFGMIQLSPDNGTTGWDWCSGYHYSDSLIAGFSHTHLSGTGIGDLADILVMPTNKEIKASHFEYGKSYSDFYRTRFSHKEEKARPGYYAVKLLDDDIMAELTVSERIGFHQYTFTNKENRSVLFDLGFYINWDKPTEVYCKPEGNDMLTGYRYSTGWAGDHKIYFAARFSEPFDSISYFCKEKNGKDIYTKAVLSFSNTSSDTLRLKVAISSVDIQGAMQNLETDKNGWDFEKAKEMADLAWEKELAKIKIETQDISRKKVFYTALYHTCIAPALFSDIDGRYKGFKGFPVKAEGYKRYTILSLWDTFRALKPLYTLINPDLTDNLVHSMLDQYRQTGWLPFWELHGNETWCMIGYHSLPVIADAILKGIGSFDVEQAYKAMKEVADSNYGGLAYYKEMNYIPSDKENESASKTLEYCFDDWCLAQVAKKLGHIDDYERYMKRSGNYKNLYDPESGFIRGRLSTGEWAEPFDPRFSRHRNDYFTEGNSWQWSWFAPHDVMGLIHLHGGESAFVEKLDRLFNESSEISGEDSSIDISGLIGQYAHGNEPSHHTAYLYNSAGVPWKTQETVNRIMNTLYSSSPDGLCGNEDCGQMSAWYVFSAMGFYPMNPVGGWYELGAPQFDRVILNLSEGKEFVIETRNLSKENIYIQRVELNGTILDSFRISYSDIIKGGKLIFTMGPEPNTGDNQPNYQTRTEFGARLEPKGQILSGAGQSAEAFENYVQLLGETRLPAIYMLYVGLDTDPTAWLEEHKNIMDKYDWNLIPQLGLSMTKDGDPEKHYEQDVSDGLYDDNIQKLIDVLKKWDRPVFIRIGYEFNGHWNGYQPESYKKAFCYITNKFRKAGLEKVATVWCYGYDDQKNSPFMDYYPGNEYVDWWGIDLFKPEEFKNPEVLSYLDNSLKYKKPLMIGESTPRSVGVLDGFRSWNDWFEPYFHLMKRQPNVKAFCYINWNWAFYPQWSDWGDGRLEENDFVSQRFMKEMEHSIFRHGKK